MDILNEVSEILSFFDKSFFLFFYFLGFLWVLFANSKFFLKFLLFFFLFFQKLLLHVRMSDHIIFRKPVNLKVRIILHHIGKPVVGFELFSSNNLFNS